MAEEKGAKAKKGGSKGKKEDGPAQNGETKTNEVREDEEDEEEEERSGKDTIFGFDQDSMITIFVFLKCLSTHKHWIVTRMLLKCTRFDPLTHACTLTHTQIYVSRPSVSVSSVRSMAPSLMSVRGQSETVRVNGTDEHFESVSGFVCVWRVFFTGSEGYGKDVSVAVQ